MTATTLTAAYHETDLELIGMFDEKNLLAIREKLDGVIPVLFNPEEEEVWTSTVGCHGKDNYQPYEGQIPVKFYRNLTITQIGWGADLFEVRLNLRAASEGGKHLVVDTQGTKWLFSYEAKREEIQAFLEAL